MSSILDVVLLSLVFVLAVALIAALVPLRKRKVDNPDDLGEQVNDANEETQEMIESAIRLEETIIREVMVPRLDMVTLQLDTSLEEALKLFIDTGFSRIPVVGEDADHIEGIAYFKDVVKVLNSRRKSPTLKSILQKPVFAPETKTVQAMFTSMQERANHIALVVDEFGGIAGLVTLEDVLEEIVGELTDEHDLVQEDQAKLLDDGSYSVPARFSLSDLDELFEVEIDDDEVDTVLGLVGKLVGKVPAFKDKATHEGLEFTVLRAAKRVKVAKA